MGTNHDIIHIIIFVVEPISNWTIDNKFKNMIESRTMCDDLSDK